jgi:Uma2 family endonuclease
MARTQPGSIDQTKGTAMINQFSFDADADEVAYYYDSHPTEEDLMSETSYHAVVIHYLIEVLHWLFAERTCAIYDNLGFYQTRQTHEHPLVPDIAVLLDTAFRHARSLRLTDQSPHPQVVFEIASEETWRKDMTVKPLQYVHMGVEEYIFYDPNVPPLWKVRPQRLRVWHRDEQQGLLLPVAAGIDGRVWSEHLSSWLVPDGTLLRLVDQQGHLRLTQAEAEAQRAKAEARRANLAERRAKTETQRAETEARRAETEARRAETEARRAALLAEKLRSLGIDPDQVA